MSNESNKQATIGDDLLFGADAIAAELNLSVPQIYNLIRAKRIPINKLGHKTIIASRKQLRRVLSPASA